MAPVQGSVIVTRRETKTAVGGGRGRKGERAEGKGGREKERLGGPDQRKSDSDQGRGGTEKGKMRSRTGVNGRTEFAGREGGGSLELATDCHDYAGRSRGSGG